MITFMVVFKIVISLLFILNPYIGYFKQRDEIIEANKYVITPIIGPTGTDINYVFSSSQNSSY